MRWLVIAAILSLPTVAFSQTQTPAVPTSVDVLILPAAGDPLTVAPVVPARNTAISAASSLCNKAATANPATPLVNPKNLELDDPFTTGRVCSVPLPSPLPDGTGYRTVAVFNGTCIDQTGTSSACSSPRSAVAVAPFSIQSTKVPPVAPTRLGVRP